jgi:hypothetical protein
LFPKVVGFHKQLTPIVAGAALVIGAGPTLLFGGSTAAAMTPLASGLSQTRLRDFRCQRALDPGARSVSVTAVMRPVSGTVMMQVKFQLLRRTKPGRRFTQVSGHNLGTWLSPVNPTLGQRPGDVWIVNHPVVDLAAPATYRFRVSFRWIGAHGHVLSTVSRNSRDCYQPELRPDLVVQSITPEAVAVNSVNERFYAVIRNRGATGAGMFEVQFTDGQVVRTASVTSLASGATTHETFIGPVCAAGGSVTVVADPLDMVDDYDRANNTLTLVCTASAVGSGRPGPGRGSGQARYTW